MSNELHPELEAAVRAAFEFRPTMGRLPRGDVQSRRAATDRGSGVPMAEVAGVAMQPARVAAADGAQLELRIYRPAAPTGAGLVFIHGGGLIAGSVESAEPRAKAIAGATGLIVVSVGYRLAPEHPYPVALEDCYCALVWTAEHAEELGIAPGRIGIGGESAGGGLAAATTLLARDSGGPAIAGAYLACPMLDPTTTTEPPEGTQWYTWSHIDNETGWRAYLPDLDDLSQAPSHAAPAFAESLHGFPRSYIDVGGLDLFRDESIAFAAGLWRAGVACELHVIPGAPHGFMTLAPDAKVVQRTDEARNEFLASW